MKEIYIAIIFFSILFITLAFLSFKKTEETIGMTTTIGIKTTTTQIETTTTTIEIQTTTTTTIEIQIEGKKIFIYADKFEPSSVEINLGDEVVWVNKDDKEHVIILSNPPLEKRILAGDSFTFQFTFTGSIEFVDRDTGAKGIITIS